MTEKRYKLVNCYIGDKSANVIEDKINGDALGFDEYYHQPIVDLLNSQDEQIQQLKKDVEYWKQVASQYYNELNIFEHCIKYWTECKDIYWDSD